MYTLLMLITSLLWGGNFVVAKLLVPYASSMTLTNLRWILAVLCLAPVVYWREKKLLPPRQSLVLLFLMGLTGVVCFNLFMFWAVERTSANNVGLLSTLNPLSIALFSFLLARERIRPLQIAAMGVSFLGVLIVLSKGQWEHILTLHFNTGDLWMLAAVAMWGIYSVLTKWVMKWVSPMMSTLYAGIFGVMVLLPINLPTFEIVHPDATFWGALVYVGVFATVLAMVFWNIGVQKIGGTAAGIFLNFNPVFTALLAYLLLGEMLSWAQLLGALVVIAGVILFTRAGSALLRSKRFA
jgi:drug/metabolite transporter (DMT)-like permease